MGEAANKITKYQPQERVVKLRSEIASKRALLTQEIDELKQRREAAMLRAESIAKLAAFGGVGLFIMQSITRALIDLRRPEQPEPLLLDAESTKKKSVHAAAGTAAGTSLVMTVLTNTLRWAAIEYLRSRFGTSNIKTAVERFKSEHKESKQPIIYSSSTD